MRGRFLISAALAFSSLCLASDMDCQALLARLCHRSLRLADGNVRIPKTAKLRPEETLRLFQERDAIRSQYDSKDASSKDPRIQRIRDAIVIAHLPIAIKHAGRKSLKEHPTLSFDDLLQQAGMTLDKAFSDFDLALGENFLAFAENRIKADGLQYKANHITSSRIGRPAYKKALGPPQEGEHSSIEKARIALGRQSLDRPIEGETSVPFSRLVPDGSERPDAIAVRKENERNRKELVNTVWEIAQTVLTAPQYEAFLLRHGQGLTVRETKEKVGVSHNAIHLREKGALERLRKALTPESETSQDDALSPWD